MMIWNASGVPVWQVAFVWAGVILFWGFVIWAGYAHITRSRYRRWDPRWDAGRNNGHRAARGGGSYRHRLDGRHVQYPQCTGGRRVGPPEDWDGPWAYLERTPALSGAGRDRPRDRDDRPAGGAGAANPAGPVVQRIGRGRLGYTIAFTGATLTVFPHTAGLGAALVYLGALHVASLLPVPGGVGVLDTLLVAGELPDGASIVSAIVAVLLFRLITYWLIIVPGSFAYRRLTREQEPETA